ncbi:hypothetical protein BHY07_13485 [Bacillus subtilis subsp. subtilis]|nr:Hypothetical Protein U712_12080 [Bacillus subtilis PY79]AIC40928.1 hypothetical protein BSUA_02649 [Bacillus subtilis subsp. subtilis str. JH642 substr. AG174]AIC45160.1 hypothetical protein BSUB_02649 [Bacillus subtilis subsp. subtilis str. AG1839]AIX08130.1 hypothetical protein OB04_02472 [Bacillus subtilis]AIY93794.1 hypothetical protein QU35_13505 [Bacillus subtilis subsp. subtilis str. 168]AJE95174.1 hypothetical protein RP72_13385 [Bacillus subtilis subsp. subtilis]AKC48050.1 hypothe
MSAFLFIGKIIMTGVHSVESLFSCQKELVFQHITSHKITFSLFDYLFFFFYNMR